MVGARGGGGGGGGAENVQSQPTRHFPPVRGVVGREVGRRTVVSSPMNESLGAVVDTEC